MLPQCQAFPAPRSVLVMDNASIHTSHMNTLQIACEARGVKILFLPPYSPDFNPIEGSFGDLKSHIRRWYRSKRKDFDSYQDFLEWAIRSNGTGPAAASRARAHFRNAGIYGVPAE